MPLGITNKVHTKSLLSPSARTKSNPPPVPILHSFSRDVPTPADFATMRPISFDRHRVLDFKSTVFLIPMTGYLEIHSYLALVLYLS